MMELNDFYWMWLNRDDATLRSSAALRPVFERLEASFLPKPKTLEATGSRDSAIEGWLDARIAKAIDKGKESVGLKAPGIEAALGLTENRVSVSLFFRLGPAPEEIRALFLDLCDLVSPTYARCGLNNTGQAIHDRHYASHRRTFYASGLFWLNFFGPGELERQGGEALATNAHARVERRAGGVLLEVGASPLDAATPEGEARLVAATRAMPPLPSEAAPAAPAPQPEAPRAPAPIITVGGVRGYLDPNDSSFWVSKHIEPPHPLDVKTIRTLGGLKGKGKPAIQVVQVLFSTEEAASANKEPLAAAGVGAWFVSLEDGKPRRA